MGKKTEEIKKPGVMIYFEILPVLENLWWWQRFAVLEAMIYYARDGKKPRFRGSLKAVWGLIQPIVDRDDTRYQKTLEARKKGGKIRGAQLTQEAKKKKACLDAELAAAELQLPDEDSSLQLNGSSISQSTISNHQSPIPNLQSTIHTLQSPISNPQTTNHTLQSPISNPSAGENGPGVEQVRLFCQQEGLEICPEDFVEYYGSKGWILSGEPVRDWKSLARRWHRKAEEKRKELEAYGKIGHVL